MNTTSSSPASTRRGATLIAALSLALMANAAADVPQVHLGVRHLDLTRADVAERVYARIESSARMLCRQNMAPWDASRLSTLKHCIATAIAEAVQQAHAPALSALHQVRVTPGADLARTRR